MVYSNRFEIKSSVLEFTNPHFMQMYCCSGYVDIPLQIAFENIDLRII